MKTSSPHWRRRDVLVGLGGVLAMPSRSAFACHETDHPPCRAVAFVPKSGGLAQFGQELETGIRAMREQLRQIDPNRRGHLDIRIIDTQSSPDATINRLQQEMRVSKPPAIIMADLLLPPQVLARLAAEFEVPIIVLGTGTTKSSSEWICQLAPSATQIAQGLLGYLAAVGNKEPVNIVATAARAPRAADFEAAILAAGGKVGVRVILGDNSGRELGQLQGELLKAAKNSSWMASIPIAAVPALIEQLRAGSGQPGPIAVDTGLGDPTELLRKAGSGGGVVALSSFSPELIATRPFAREVNARARATSDRPLTPAAAATATATQVLATAAVSASVRDSDYGPATRASLMAVKTRGEELVVAWESVEFDPQTFQNRGARVVALGLREGRIVTVWRPFKA
jgi:ABC-type branched-subunit amino acid transport system substrate-binding protein